MALLSDPLILPFLIFDYLRSKVVKPMEIQRVAAVKAGFIFWFGREKTHFDP
jgi:hypothetical protein